MARMRGVIFFVLMMEVCLASACYSRVELMPRSNPSKAQVFMDFTVDPSLVKLRAGEGRRADPNGENIGPSARRNSESVKAVERLGEKLTATLTSDLREKSFGVPVEDSAAADLKLSGRFRSDPSSGAALDWQIVEVRSGAVLLSGEAKSMFMNIDEFADQILVELVDFDADLYTAVGGLRPAVVKDALAPPRSGTDGRLTYAVIVGVESYKEGVADATHAESDARLFADFARETFGVPPEQIVYLAGADAVRAKMADALESWLPENAQAPGSTVLFYFSGHGAADPQTGQAHLLPYDVDAFSIKGSGYALEELWRRLGALSNARSFVFLDATFAGLGRRSVAQRGVEAPVKVRNVAAPPAGVLVLAAAAPEQAAGLATEANHGLFTFHLLEGLCGGADRDDDRDVSFAEAFYWVSREVTRAARTRSREQTPWEIHSAQVDPEDLSLVNSLVR